MDKKEQAQNIAILSAKALGVPQEGIIIEGLELKMKLLLQSDILLPIIVSMANYLGDALLDATNQYGSIFPFDLQKNEETLCYVNIVENNKKNAPHTIQMLLCMEVCEILFKPTFDNVIDVTNVVKSWREALAEIPNNRIIDIKIFHNELIGKNLSYVVKGLNNPKPQKSK